MSDVSIFSRIYRKEERQPTFQGGGSNMVNLFDRPPLGSVI